MTTITEGPRSVADAVAGLDIRAQMFVDGAYVDAVSGETFDCVSPITGEVVATVAAGDTADVDRAVAGARTAFESGVWSRLAPKKRKRVLQKLAALMSEHAEELALLETIDMGKPIRDATNVDVPLATECIAWYGEAIDKVYDEIAPTGPDAHVSIVREPLGVVGAVVPWNFPLMMASWKLGPGARDRQQRRPQARGAIAADRASARRSSPPRPAFPTACSRSSPASARRRGRRSAGIRTST